MDIFIVLGGLSAPPKQTTRTTRVDGTRQVAFFVGKTKVWSGSTSEHVRMDVVGDLDTTTVDAPDTAVFVHGGAKAITTRSGNVTVNGPVASVHSVSGKITQACTCDATRRPTVVIQDISEDRRMTPSEGLVAAAAAVASPSKALVPVPPRPHVAPPPKALVPVPPRSHVAPPSVRPPPPTATGMRVVPCKRPSDPVRVTSKSITDGTTIKHAKHM